MKPLAVLISDIHYNLHTLELADKAMRMAISKANDLEVPVIIAGDIHDTKANLRAECVTAMIETMTKADEMPYLLIGNHDKINEKSLGHALNFLWDVCRVVQRPANPTAINMCLVPYHNDVEELRLYLKTIPKGSTLIMHQGLKKANSGEYIQDKSALNPEDVAGLRIISGHYHTRQTIELPDGGKWDFIGNPYTLNWAEANDPNKGFQVLYSDGSLEFVPTKLRKHIIINYDTKTKISEWSRGPIYTGGGINDLVWLKVKGNREEISRFNKDTFIKEKGLPKNIKLTYEYEDLPNNSKYIPKNGTQEELLDSLIDGAGHVSDEGKIRLKKLWKNL